MPCGSHKGGPQRSIPDSSWPSSSTGWWSPLPGARPSRRKHLQEPKFCRPRPPLASHRGPLLAPPSPSSISGSQTRHFRDGGADAALGSLPAARLPGPGARTTGGTAPRNPGFRGWPRRPVKGATDGAQPTGAPRTGRRRPPGNRARHREPAAQPAARVGLPPSPHRRPRSSAPPPLPGSAAPGPCPPAPVWASFAGGAATFQPGSRRPEQRKQEEGEERRREGDTALAGALHSQKPSQSPVQPPPPPPPGRQGAQWAAGARWPG